MDRRTLSLRRSATSPARRSHRQLAGLPARLASFAIVAAVSASCTPAATGAPGAAPTAPAAATVSSPSAGPVDPVPSATTSAGAIPTPSADPPASADPSPEASPSPSVAPSEATGPFRMDIWRPDALVTQPNLLWCVPGAAAIMVDLVSGHRAVDASALGDMYAYGQSLAVYPNEGPGVDPAGWVGILARWGAGDYAWRTYARLPDALHHAALRMRQTGRPVGLIVGIHGQHAWVLTGFSATADPLGGPFTVTGVAVAGSLWPVQRYYLGYFDMPPDTWITPAKLVPAVRPFHADVPTQWDGRYVTIEP
jgi:hypothetical protein